jgi:DNA-binding MarR family transcriptional regulator
VAQDDQTGTATEVTDALRALMWGVQDAQAALARRVGVGVTDVQALQVLADRSVGTVGLGTALGIRSASATVLADRLQSAGHLRRVPHASDGRRVVLELTDSARTEVIAALAPFLHAVGAIVADLDDTERATVTQFLRRTTAAIEDYVRQTGPEPATPEP